MRIQFIQDAFVVVDEFGCILKSFPLQPWELEYDALGKIQAIDYIKKELKLAVLDYNDCYEKIRYRK